MAIYSFQMRNLTRCVQKANGPKHSTNSCASAAYITGLRIRCEQNGKTYSYGHADRVVYTKTIVPEGAPEEWKDPAVLWNEVEAVEKNANARLAKKFIAALPNELSLDQQIEISESFAKILTDKGIAVTCAIHHNPDTPEYAGKPKNDHLHVNAVNRQISQDGKWMCKKKQEYVRDENGDRVPRIDPTTGKQKVDSHGRKQWVRHSVESNVMDKKELLDECREAWAKLCNGYLDEDHKIDHRSYAEQGIEKIPTAHEGWYARKIEAEGGTSYKCEYNREVRADNGILAKLQAELNILAAEAAELTARIRDQITGQAKETPSEDEWHDGNEYHKWHDFDPEHNYAEHPVDILFIKTDNPLVNQILHSNLAAQYRREGRAPQNYIVPMAEAVTNILHNNIDSRNIVRTVYDNISNEMRTAYTGYRTAGDKLSEADQKIAQRKALDKNQAIHDKYAEVKDGTDPITKHYAKDYKDRHKAELRAYDKAYDFLCRCSPTDKPQPMEELRAERKEARTEQNACAEAFTSYRDDLDTLYQINDILNLTAGLDPDALTWTPEDPIPNQSLPKDLRRKKKRRSLYSEYEAEVRQEYKQEHRQEPEHKVEHTQRTQPERKKNRTRSKEEPSL